MNAPGFLQAFKYRDYRMLWSGAFLSSLGTWTQDVALAWLIHTQMGDPFYLGLRSFAADAPLVAFMLVGGAVADRVNRRYILLTSQVLQMTFAAILGVLYFMDRLGIAPILLFAFLTGLAQSQSAPTYQAVLTSLVPPAQIPNAVALNSLQFNLSRMVGPVIAGLLLARGGTQACFVVNALSFLAVIIAIWRIDLPPPVEMKEKQSLASSLGEGLRLVWDTPRLRMLTSLAAAASFLGFPLVTYLPVIASDVLHTGAEGFSLLLSAFGAGAIVGALATAQRGQAEGRGRLLLVAFMVYGVTALAAVFSRWQGVSMALLFVAGIAVVTAYSSLNSLVQENAPAAFKGRVLSIYGFAFRGGQPLGGLLAGLAVRQLGASSVVGGFTLVLAVIAGITLVRSPSMRSL
jgi:predicted MFS family arabinose efflux permease